MPRLSGAWLYANQGLLRPSNLRPAMRLFRRRSNEPKPSALNSHLERLYSAAKETFKGGRTLTDDDVLQLRTLLDAIPLKEIGMEDIAATARQDNGNGEKKSLLSRFGIGNSSRIPTITYFHICENAEFTIGIFCLPNGCALPFHDHPNMTVFSRLLYGKLRVKAYDWSVGSKTYIEYGETQTAKLSVQANLGEGDPPLVMFPTTGGNIHSFTAESSCAVLDLLAPPYDMDDPEKSCSYYQELTELQPDGTITLQKIPDPHSIKIVGSRYHGIQVE